jgi:hypothetical protein
MSAQGVDYYNDSEGFVGYARIGQRSAVVALYRVMHNAELTVVSRYVV